MLVAVIILYALCHGPCLIDNVLVAFGHVDRLHYGSLKHIRQAFAVMSYFNSCVNPIVYAFMSKNFREGFKIALCMCLYRDAPSGYSSTTVNYEHVSMAANMTPRPTPHPSPYVGARPNGHSEQYRPHYSSRPYDQTKALNSNCLLIPDNRTSNHAV